MKCILSKAMIDQLDEIFGGRFANQEQVVTGNGPQFVAQQFAGYNEIPWNSLPGEVVEADTIETFKGRLHKCMGSRKERSCAALFLPILPPPRTRSKT